MLTIGDGINQILNEVLIGTYRGHWNTLNGAIDNQQQDLTVRYDIQGIGEGSVLAAEQELMYVVPGGVNATARKLTVLRGFMGTTPQPHADWLVIEINPRYPRLNVLNAMHEELLSWPHELYRTASTQTTITDGTSAIDLDALIAPGVGSAPDVTGIIKVFRQKQGYDSGRWIPLSGWRHEYDIDQPGSNHLFLAFDWRWDIRYGSTKTIKILYSSKFDDVPFNETVDPVATLGIPTSMHEIMKYGAAWRLVTGREGRRLFTEAESESRTAQEVPVQASAAFGMTLKKLRDARISEEIDRLRRRYPIRRSSG